MHIPRLYTGTGPLVLEKGIPPNYRGFMLSADTWYSESPSGFVLVQQKGIKDKWIRYMVFRPLEKITISFNDDPGFLQLVTNLKSDFKLYVENNGKVHMRTAQFFLQYSSPKERKLELKAGRDYEIMEFRYPESRIQDYTNAFPILKRLPFKSHWVLPKNLEAVSAILTNAFNEEAQMIYLDIQPENILFLLVSQLWEKPQINADDAEIEAAHRARAMIWEQNRNFPDMKAIARKVSLSDYKLRLLFKMLFRKTAFDLYMDAKMDYAYKQVTETNLSIKMIALDAGYKWPMNFATSFHKRFGDAPETLREKQRDQKG